MIQYYSTFILDFMTIDFEHDSNIVFKILSYYKKICGFNKEDDVFDLDEPISNAGWSFSKLFLAGGFVERLYQGNTDEMKYRILLDWILTFTLNILMNTPYYFSILCHLFS